jgi:Tfp pilus assembly protein PilO
MIRVRLDRITAREAMLATAIVMLLVGFVGYHRWLVPAYHRWQGTRAVYAAKQLERQKLTDFVSVREQVLAQHALLDEQVFQVESDQITLSQFLHRMEAMARKPSLTIVNAKPMPVENLVTHRRYPVRISVSGTLPEVCQFVMELLSSADVTGLESFMLRATQSDRHVECSLAIWMVQLRPLPQGTSHPSAAVAAWTGDTRR